LAEPAARTWPTLDLDSHPNLTLPPDFDDRLALLLDDLAALAIESGPGRHWRVYFGNPDDRDIAASVLSAALAAYVAISRADVQDEGWAGKVQQTLSAVRVGDLIIAPPWDVPRFPHGVRPIVIVIEPSVGFGTGHHQSTRLCLRLLQRERLTGRRVADAGTGSGVLAIAAAMLGATDVVAIDSDADAVQSARENALRNGVLAEIDARVADLDALAIDPADVVLANLTMIALRRHRTQLADLVRAAGTLIVSGFTHDQVPLVVEAFPGFEAVSREVEDDWVALGFRRRPAE
jgi:ribosomal protein L11 methyltransferase